MTFLFLKSIVILILSVKMFFFFFFVVHFLISIVNSEYFNRFDKVYSNIVYIHIFWYMYFSVNILHVNSVIINLIVNNIKLVLVVHNLKILGASQCVILLAFLQPILYSVICKCPDGVAASGYNLHSHLCMAQCKKCPSDLLDLDTHIFWHFSLIMYGFASLFWIPNCPLF